MKLLDKKEYEKTLRELMETPFGGYQQKQAIKQPEVEPKVINKQPLENQNTPVYATPQPQIHIIKEPQSQPSPISLQKTGTAQISLTKLGVFVGLGGAIFGYLYSTTPSIQLETKTLLSKLSTFTSNPIIVGSVILGVFLCTLGLVFKKC